MFLSERVPLCSRSVYKDHRSFGKCRQARHLEAGIDDEANQVASWFFGPVLEYPPFRRFLVTQA